MLFKTTPLINKRGASTAEARNYKVGAGSQACIRIVYTNTSLL